MSLGEDITAALPVLRAAAESRMTDTCRITAAGAGPVLNETTGVYESTPGAVSYEGICELKMGDPQPHAVDAGGQALTEQRNILKLPMLTSVDVKPDHIAVILTSATDPALPGTRVRITGQFAQTYATARRFPVELVSGA